MSEKRKYETEKDMLLVMDERQVEDFGWNGYYSGRWDSIEEAEQTLGIANKSEFATVSGWLAHGIKHAIRQRFEEPEVDRE